MQRFKVTAVDGNNNKIAQVCVLATCERQAADFLHNTLIKQYEMGDDAEVHGGIKVLELDGDAP